jgi:NADH:ubiquinone oxidoreductase subunit 2 (subunit N)
LLIFDLKNFLTLNEFRRFSSLQFFTVTIILVLFSMAGLPPFAGFVSKFLMFFFLIYKQGFFFLFFFTVINIFIIYFYIQNVRFLFTTNTLSFLFFKNNYAYINFNLVFLAVLFNFFNFFGILFTEDLLIYIDNICQYINCI